MSWMQALTIIFFSLAIVANLGTIWFSSVSSWYIDEETK